MLDIWQLDHCQATTTAADLTTLRWNSDGSLLATLREDSNFTIWTADLMKMREFAAIPDDIKTLDWKNSDELTTFSSDGVITLWQSHQSAPVKTSEGHEGWKEALWNKSGTLLACLLMGKFEILDDQLNLIMERNEQCTAMDWVPTESQLVTGNTEGELKVWDLESLDLAHTLKNNREMITRILCHPQENAFALVSSSWDSSSDWVLQICYPALGQTQRFAVPCSVSAM